MEMTYDMTSSAVPGNPL